MTDRPMTEGLEPCPFCKGETGALMKANKAWRVWCLRPAEVCGYIGPDKPTEADAIAHHNQSSTSAAVRGMREALEWYGEQARLCRLIHSEGDAGRHALAHDGGKRALSVLSGIETEQAQARSPSALSAPTDRLQSKESSS